LHIYLPILFFILQSILEQIMINYTDDVVLVCVYVFMCVRVYVSTIK